MFTGSFQNDLAERLKRIESQGLHRELRRVDSSQGPRIQIGGKKLINFSSNDYLGLATAPELIEAAAQAARDFGSGAGASRLICGSLAPYHELEEALAAFKQTEAVLTFVTGYAAALGTIRAVVGTGDTVILDRLAHASLVDGARMSGARLRVFAHNDLDDLEHILRSAVERHAGAEVKDNHAKPRCLIITESLFSMDGDHAPLAQLVEMKDRYGAWLMVDEAHATGVFGPRGRGLAAQFGVDDRIEIQMGTLGKAVGAAGGYIAGSRKLIEFLVNQARTFIFSTAPVPAAAAAARAGIQLIGQESGEQRRAALFARLGELRASPEAPGPIISPIQPVIVGDEAKATRMATDLREAGIFVPAIRYPTVAKGAARLRVTLTAAHSAEDVKLLNQSINTLLRDHA